MKNSLRPALPLAPVIAAVLCLTAVLDSNAALAAPSFGYADIAWALPAHAAWSTTVEDGKRVTQGEAVRSDFGLPALSGGVGIGYAGLNAQLDFRNALHLTTGALTFGIRAPLTLGIFELWLRAGIGPSLVFDGFNPSKVAVSGGIATDLEAGVDVFLLPWLALGFKAVGTPQYSWASNFSVDLGLNVGLRLSI